MLNPQKPEACYSSSHQLNTNFKHSPCLNGYCYYHHSHPFSTPQIPEGTANPHCHPQPPGVECSEEPSTRSLRFAEVQRAQCLEGAGLSLQIHSHYSQSMGHSQMQIFVLIPDLLN